MNYKKAYILSTVMLLLAIALALIFSYFEETSALSVITIIITIALMIGAVAIRIIFYKCPHCGKLLPSRGFPKDFCGSCGEKLDK